MLGKGDILKWENNCTCMDRGLKKSDERIQLQALRIYSLDSCTLMTPSFTPLGTVIKGNKGVIGVVCHVHCLQNSILLADNYGDLAPRVMTNIAAD